MKIKMDVLIVITAENIAASDLPMPMRVYYDLRTGLSFGKKVEQ